MSVYKLLSLYFAVIPAQPTVGALSSGIHCFQYVLGPRVKPEDDDFLLYTQTLNSADNVSDLSPLASLRIL